VAIKHSTISKSCISAQWDSLQHTDGISIHARMPKSWIASFMGFDPTIEFLKLVWRYQFKMPLKPSRIVVHKRK